MKELIMVGFIIGIMACGKAAVNPAEAPTEAPISAPSLPAPSESGVESCTVEQTDAGALIRCPDGSSALLLHSQTVETCKKPKGKGKPHE